MAGRCVVKERCPQCNGNTMQVFQQEDGSFDAFCFGRCQKPIPIGGELKRYEAAARLVPSAEDLAAQLEEYNECEVLRGYKARQIRPEPCAHFDVRAVRSVEDGKTLTHIAFPYQDEKGKIVAFKLRSAKEKKFFSIGSMAGATPFGWYQATRSTNRLLIITEGEFDAMSVWQAFERFTPEEYEHTKPDVISLPSGAASVKKSLSPLLKQMAKYQKVIACFDNDEAGEAAFVELKKLLPTVAKAELKLKDANEYLLESKAKELYNALKWNSVDNVSTGSFRTLDSLWEAAKKQPEKGAPWPWETATEATRGIRTGETHYFGAGPKMGKSEIVNQLAAHCIKELGWKIALIKPEEPVAKTVKMLANKIAGTRFHDPNVPFDMNRFEEAGEYLKGDRVLILDVYQELRWDNLEHEIRAAAASGVKAVFLDPITNLTNGMSAADANVELQAIAQKLSALAIDLDVVIFIFCHLKNPTSGPEHNRGGVVESSQFAGSRAMARSCNYMWGLQGNKDPDLSEDERNLRQLVLLEDREFGEVVTINLRWQKHTTLFQEI